MQVPELPEKLVTGRQADFLGYFFQFGKFTPSEIAHYLEAYSTPAQLHAASDMYRAFPANERFNQAQREPNDVRCSWAPATAHPLRGWSQRLPKVSVPTNAFMSQLG
jgi:hypothetical protein